MMQLDINPLVKIVRDALPQEQFGEGHKPDLKGVNRYRAGATTPLEIAIYEMCCVSSGVKETSIGSVKLTATPSQTSTPQVDVIAHTPRYIPSCDEPQRIESIMEAVANAVDKSGAGYWVVYYKPVEKENMLHVGEPS